MSECELSHEEALAVLDTRGYCTDWVPDSDDIVRRSIPERVRESNSRHATLDYHEVEGQVLDGVFENGGELDFDRLFEFDGLVGRMIYYQLRWHGADYNWDNLIEDLEQLTDTYTSFSFSQEGISPPEAASEAS
jgi:hypothetical protein